MADEHVELLEAVLVQQQLDPFAGGQLAAGVLGIDSALPAAQPCFGAALVELFQDVLHAVSVRLAAIRLLRAVRRVVERTLLAVAAVANIYSVRLRATRGGDEGRARLAALTQAGPRDNQSAWD